MKSFSAQQKDQLKNASAGSTAGALQRIGYNAPGYAKKENPGTQESLLHTPAEKMAALPQSYATVAVQRQPTGTYANAVPTVDGTYWDQDVTTTHKGANVPSRVTVVTRNPTYGGTPSVNPPGWNWLQTKYGKLKGQWVRFHIINARLGGPGNNATNLVPTLTALNLNGNWRALEDEAKASASTDQQWTYVDVGIQYDNDYPAGIPRRINAEWGYFDDDEDWIVERDNVHLSQNNPDDGQNENYLQAAQVTKMALRQTYRLNNLQADAIKDLLDQNWASQTELNNAIEDAEDNNDRLGEGRWFDVIGRMYVDEDDDLPGPYSIVFRKRQ